MSTAVTDWQMLRDTPRHPLNHRKPAQVSSIDPQKSERADHAGRSAFLAEHLFIHTHLPKTAGTALSKNLSALFGAVHSMDTRISRSAPFAELTDDDLRQVHFVSGHFNYGLHRRVPRKPLYLAVVREPLSRAISWYRYMLKSPDKKEHQHVAGRTFEEAWRESERNPIWERRNRQAYMMLGEQNLSESDWPALQARVDQDYFLVIPQDRLSDAVHGLRDAFGVQRTTVQKANVSKTAEVVPSEQLAQEIRNANALDGKLYEYVSTTFDKRLQSACKTIAHRCLQPVDQDR